MSNNKRTGVIVAGGKSSRMGQDKGLMHFCGKPMIEHCIDALKPLCSEILISTNNNEYASFGYPLVRDVYCNRGPIGGLFAAIQSAKHKAVIIMPCDMPHATTALLQSILSATIENSCTTLIAQSAKTGRLYPTLGLFNKSTLPIIEMQIKQGNNKLMSLLEKLEVQTIQITDEVALRNYNAPTDMLPTFDNMILIAGNGRNVGKTLLACRIIKELSLTTPVTAVKISSHFHLLNPDNPLLVETEKYTISRESLHNSKDSSRMLQAGAHQVYYVQCHNEHLTEMVEQLRHYLPQDTPVVIESGGLYNCINPKIFYFIQDPQREVLTNKKALREGKNKRVLLSEQVESINLNELATQSMTSPDVK